MRYGVLIRKGSLWIGAHHSPYNRRWCFNLLPCLTVWVALSGGNIPDPKGSLVYWASKEPDTEVIKRRLSKPIERKGLKLIAGGKP